MTSYHRFTMPVIVKSEIFLIGYFLRTLIGSAHALNKVNYNGVNVCKKPRRFDFKDLLPLYRIISFEEFRFCMNHFQTFANFPLLCQS